MEDHIQIVALNECISKNANKFLRDDCCNPIPFYQLDNLKVLLMVHRSIHTFSLFFILLNPFYPRYLVLNLGYLNSILYKLF